MIQTTRWWAAAAAVAALLAGSGCTQAKKDQGTTFTVKPGDAAAQQQAREAMIRDNTHMNAKAKAGALAAMQRAQSMARTQPPRP